MSAYGEKGRTLVSTLTLVDLAGSERLGKTGGDRSLEAVSGRALQGLEQPAHTDTVGPAGIILSGANIADELRGSTACPGASVRWTAAACLSLPSCENRRGGDSCEGGHFHQ